MSILLHTMMILYGSNESQKIWDVMDDVELLMMMVILAFSCILFTVRHINPVYYIEWCVGNSNDDYKC